MESEARRVAGQHARAQAQSLSWKRFFGGSFKRDHRSWSQGAEGEEAVGKVLEDLAEEGWCVIHDVSFGRGNIDHILVGPGGIFTIETKSHGGKLWLDRLDPKMLSQAYAEKKALEEITLMEVDSLLVFSRAYIVDRVPARRRGVLILPARMLAGHLSRRPAVVSAERAAVIHRRLALAVGQAAS
ncbi:MAG: nuclease-related domain-containing protein [Solirubrobacterales bacterium]